MNNKKILLAAILILVFLGLALLLYFVLFRDIINPTNNENENINNANSSTNGLPPITNRDSNTNQAVININSVNTNRGVIIDTNTGQPIIDPVAQGRGTAATPVVNTSARAVDAQPDGAGIRYYDETLGKFYELAPDGTERELTDKVFPDAVDIAWSPKDDKAVVSFPDNSKILYDFDRESQITLPRQWDDIGFSPTGDKLGFKNMAEDYDDRWLAVANTDGSEVRYIEPFGDMANDVAINWSPSGQVLATYREAVSGSAQEVYFIGLEGENLKSVETNGRGFEGKWSPAGDQLLYSVYTADNQYKPSLYLVDASGDQTGANEIRLGLSTWPSRCAFSASSPTLYCAVPQVLGAGSGIFPDTAVNTNDLFYKIDANTGTRILLARPDLLDTDLDYTVTSVTVSGNEHQLYFTDGNTGRVYAITLP